MANYQITYWHEIPSQVDARDPGGKPHKEPLSQRFLELIDLVASKRKLGGTDDYLAGWRKGPKLTQDGSAVDVAKAVAAELEAQFETIRAQAIAQSSPASGA
jgi:Virulence factor